MNERKSDGRANYRDYLAKWKKKLTKENMAVVALLGLLLMVIAIPADRFSGDVQENAGKDTREGTSAIQEGMETGEAADGGDAASGGEGYAKRMEEELQELLSAMEGVGEVKVMITIRDSGEQVVEKDVPSESGWVSETDSAGGTRESESARQEESTVYITDSEGNRTPYISQTTQPEIEGVTVVAQGGGDALIQKNITEVIQALFDIEAHKIKVVKMK